MHNPVELYTKCEWWYWLTPQTMTKHMNHKHLFKIYIIWASYSDIFAAGFDPVVVGSHLRLWNFIDIGHHLGAHLGSCNLVPQGVLPLAWKFWWNDLQEKGEGSWWSCACSTYCTPIFYTLWCCPVISTFLWFSKSTRPQRPLAIGGARRKSPGGDVSSFQSGSQIMFGWSMTNDSRNASVCNSNTFGIWLGYFFY